MSYDPRTTKDFSIIIPIYNEGKILEQQLNLMIHKIHVLLPSVHFEIILVDNHSSDNTIHIAKQLSVKFKNIKILKIKTQQYGYAFLTGLKISKYNYIVQFDIDFWDIDFLSKASNLLDQFDIIIGSKNLPKSKDERHYFRKVLSKSIELIIRYYFKVPLTDTHGLKFINKRKIINLIGDLVCNNHFFDTELLIKCFFYGYRIKELPVRIKEIRKSRFPIIVRIYDVIWEFNRLLKVKRLLRDRII